MKKFALLGIILSILVIVPSCTKKPKEVVPETIWSGTTNIQGIPLSSTLTIFSDDSFILDASTSFLGISMNFERLIVGKIEGNSKKDREIDFIVEELSSEISSMLQMAGLGEIPLPLEASAIIEENIITLQDIGLGQELSLERQETE